MSKNYNKQSSLFYIELINYIDPTLSKIDKQEASQERHKTLMLSFKNETKAIEFAEEQVLKIKSCQCAFLYLFTSLANYATHFKVLDRKGKWKEL